uniref:beta-N-acetylhexosaminidase n=1 Tax=Plectus sambesii TaxID=2011161 RepID=A0A914WNU3_9BILA
MLLTGERSRAWRMPVCVLLLLLCAVSFYIQLSSPFADERIVKLSEFSGEQQQIFDPNGDLKWKPGAKEDTPERAPSWWRSQTDDADLELPVKLVHLDLKGAAPRVDYLRQLFPLLRKLGATGLLIEYEDMFPYSGNLSVIRSGQSYTSDDISTIIKVARMNHLDVVPLVQTFGHMEWLLKHEEFRDIRELEGDATVICPTAPRAWMVIKDLLRQVRQLHPSVTMFHIGSDEAWHVGEDERCQKALTERYHDSKMELMLAHVTRTARFLKRELKIERVLMWNDMFSETDVLLMNKSRLGELLEPVVWGYARDVNAPGYFPEGMFDRYSEVFQRLWLGSAFKGANGPSQSYIDVNRYLETQESYMRLLSDNRRTLAGRTVGIVLTGWQRYDHFASLCELLPVGIPSLATALLFLGDKRTVRRDDLQERVRRILSCSERGGVNWPAAYSSDPLLYTPPESTVFMQCAFPGSDLYDLIERLRYDKLQVDSFFNDPTVQGWMGEYQLSRRYGSKYRARKQSEAARELLDRLARIESQLRTSLRAIFYSDTVDEWMYSNIRSPLHQLQNFIVRAERILNMSSFPSRPLPRLPSPSTVLKRNDVLS